MTKAAMRSAGGLLGCLTLLACSAPQLLPPPKTLAPVERFTALTISSPAERSACERSGGLPQPRGLRRDIEVCVKPYADAGKSCTDSSQCEGQCLTPSRDGMTAFDNATGVCQADNAAGGCQGEVLNGHVEGILCVD